MATPPPYSPPNRVVSVGTDVFPADLFLLCADGQIHAHSSVLCLAAGVFKDCMQTATASEGTTLLPGSLLRVPCTEDVGTMLSFCHVIYPNTSSDISMDNVGTLLEMARKYNAPCVSQACKTVLELQAVRAMHGKCLGGEALPMLSLKRCNCTAISLAAACRCVHMAHTLIVAAAAASTCLCQHHNSHSRITH
jgi:hypothetical protein